MSGTALSQLLDFASTTSALGFSGIEDIVNEGQDFNYGLSWLISGGNDRRVQGGASIRDDLMLDAGNTGAFYNPGYNRTYSNPQVLTNHTLQWAFYENHWMFLDVEQDLQGVGMMNTKSKRVVFKNVLAAKRKRFATNTSNDIEKALFAQPNGTYMEGAGIDRKPMSLFAYANEYGATAGTIFDANGRDPAGTGLGTNFTTIMNVPAASAPGFRCWQLDYSDAAPTTTAGNYGANNLYTAFSNAVKLVNASNMPYKPGESTSNNTPEDYAWLCSMRGETHVEKLSRSSQNYFRLKANDADYGSPSFAGIPFRYVAEMNNAFVYPTSGTTAPAIGSGAGEFDNMNGSLDPTFFGPRYMLASKSWLKPVFHDEHYFAMRPEITPSGQPDAKINVMSLWYNIWCRSRRKLAFVYPSADITGS